MSTIYTYIHLFEYFEIILLYMINYMSILKYYYFSNFLILYMINYLLLYMNNIVYCGYNSNKIYHQPKRSYLYKITTPITTS